MKELEFVRKKVFEYVDLDVFVEGDMYYFVDVVKGQSLIAVCLTKDHEKVIFKVKYYIRGDFGISTIDDDKFTIYNDMPNLSKMRIFPVELSFLVDLMNAKIRVLSEIELIY